MRKGMRAMITGLLLFSCVFPLSVKGDEVQEESELVSQYAVIYHYDEDMIIYDKNKDQMMYPASLTKTMTMLVALEQEQNLDKIVTIQPDVLADLEERNASVAGFTAGEQVSFRDLLYGAMLPSGADATGMIAYEIAGSEAAFVALMNEKAQSLEMTHTHFTNASGLHDKNHYSSAHDMMILLQEALKHDCFYTCDTYRSDHQPYEFTSTAHNMAIAAGIDDSFLLGTKTGYTLEGGLCISFLTEVNDMRYLVVLGNAGNDPQSYQNIKDAYYVYELLKTHYTLQTLYQAGDGIDHIEVNYGQAAETELCTHEDVSLMIMDGKYTEEIKLYHEMWNAPINCEEPLGELHILDGMGNIRESYSLYAKTAVERDWIAYLMQVWWLYMALILLAGYFLYRRYGDIMLHRQEAQDLISPVPKLTQNKETKNQESASFSIQEVPLKQAIHTEAKQSKQVDAIYMQVASPLPILSHKSADKQPKFKHNSSHKEDHSHHARKMKPFAQSMQSNKNDKTSKTRRKQSTKGKKKAKIQYIVHKPKKKG